MTARTVLITGANSGLGLATALELAKRGHHVVGTTRSKAKGAVLLDAAREAGLDLATEVLDVTDADRCEQVIAEVVPDVLVNNAGYSLTAPMELVPDAEAEDLLATMLIAPMRLARLSIPAMRSNGWGRIINISSIMGRISTPLTGWYQAAKHGLEGASDALRMEVARDGIDVVLIEPGLFETAILDDFAADRDRFDDERYAQVYRRMREGLERGRAFMGDPVDVGRVVARAVASSQPRARYLVGTDAQMLDLTRSVAPTRIQDWLQRTAVGL